MTLEAKFTEEGLPKLTPAIYQVLLRDIEVRPDLAAYVGELLSNIERSDPVAATVIANSSKKIGDLYAGGNLGSSDQTKLLVCTFMTLLYEGLRRSAEAIKLEQ